MSLFQWFLLLAIVLEAAQRKIIGKTPTPEHKKTQKMFIKERKMAGIQ